MNKREKNAYQGGWKILKRILLIQFIVLLAMETSNAQGNHREDAGNHFISLGFSSDAFAGLELGYSLNPGIDKVKDLQIYGRAGIPVLLAIKDGSLDSWNIDLGVNSGLLGSGRFGLITDIRFFMMHHKQVLGTFVPLGIDLSLTPAYRFQKGYLGIQLRWDQTLATHISFSDYVKNAFNELNIPENQAADLHAEDGWYSSTGSYLGLGIEIGRAIGSRYFFLFDLGMIQFTSPYTGMVDAMSMGQVPLYMDLRLRFSL